MLSATDEHDQRYDGAMRTLAIALLFTCACSGDDDHSRLRPDATSAGCSTSPDTCTGDTICIATCEPVVPRAYRITNISHSVPATKPDGSPWDVGSAPDLFVVVSVNAVQLAETQYVSDQLSAAWPGPFNIQLTAGASLVVASFDDDVSANDEVFTCQASPVTATQLRARTLRCEASGYRLTFDINPL